MRMKVFGRALRDVAVEEIGAQAWDGRFWRTLIGDRAATAAREHLASRVPGA